MTRARKGRILVYTNSIGGKPIDPANLADGTVIVYDQTNDVYHYVDLTTVFALIDHTHSQYLTSITKAMVEGVLTGNITTHTHSQYLTAITKAMVEAVLTGTVTTHNHSGVYAPVTHDHDGVYSPAGHNHDAAYSSIGHNHSGVYAPATHSHAEYLTGITKAMVEAVLTGTITSHNHSGVYALVAHNHDGTYEPVITTKNTAFNKNFGTTVGTVAEGNHTHSQYLTAITKAMVEAVLTGTITSHNHSGVYAPASHTHDDRYYTETEVDTLLAGKSDSTHTHDGRYYTETEVDTLLAGKASTSHNHSGVYEPVFTKNTAFNKNFGSTAGTVVEGNDARLSDARPPTAHTHDDRYYTESEVNTLLAGKAATSHGNHVPALQTANNAIFLRNDNSWQQVTPANIGAEPAFTKNNAFNKNFGSTAGTVCQGNDSRLSDARTPTSHTHDDRYYTESEVNSLLAGKSDTSHNHNTVYLGISAKAADSEKLDGIDGSGFYRQVGSTSATVGGGWMTVAECGGGRYHGEVIVTDADSSDHSFIRIDWLRSYADSNFSVLNIGGHVNRITGVRVLYTSSDITYGTYKLQVYVTVSSNYRVSVVNLASPSGYRSLSAVTPIIENSISGYATHGNQLTSLDECTLAAEEGIMSGGNIYEAGTALSSKYLGISAKAADSDKLDGLDSTAFATAGHNHSGVYEPIFTKNNAFNKNFGSTAGTVCQGNDSRLSDARTPTSHTHDDRYYTESEVDNKIAESKSISHGYRYYYTLWVYGEHNKYYPFTIAGGDQNVKRDILIKRSYSETHPAEWYSSTHGGGLTLKLKANFGGWGGANYGWEIHELEEMYNPTFGGCYHTTSFMTFAIMLRGGGTGGAVYHVYSDQPIEGVHPIHPDGDGQSTGTFPIVFYNGDLVQYSTSTYKWNMPAPLTTPNSEDIRIRKFITLVQSIDTLVGGTSGTSPLNISGNAATATNATNATNAATATYANNAGGSYQLTTDTNAKENALQYWQLSGNGTLNPDTGWWYGLRMSHGNADTYYSATLAFDFHSDIVKFRRKVGGSNQSWRSLLHDGNFGTTAGTVCQGNDSRLSDARTPTAHTHDDRYYTESEVNSLLAGKAASSHTHDDRYYTESEVNSLLAGKSDTSHNHSGVYEPAFSKNNAFNKNFGTASGTVCQGNDSRLSNERTPSNGSVTYAKIATDLTSRQAVSASDINWATGGVYTKTLTAATTFTFSNLQLNKVITFVASGNFTITLPAYCKRISGEYDGSTTNYIQFHCTNNASGSEEVWYTISQQAT